MGISLLFNVQKYIGEKVHPDEKLVWVQCHIGKGFAGKLYLMNYRLWIFILFFHLKKSVIPVWIHKLVVCSLLVLTTWRFTFLTCCLQSSKQYFVSLFLSKSKCVQPMDITVWSKLLYDNFVLIMYFNCFASIKQIIAGSLLRRRLYEVTGTFFLMPIT